MGNMLRNPVIPGFYPDPSICRDGEDFYLACSSFELSPGIPIFHSRDLVHWQQIANAMTPENGFYMERNCCVGGVMAPTIRKHGELFYIINTNFADRGNYIVTASDPRGPWSEPHWLDDVPGIDASIFFDDDGQAYVIGTGECWDNGAGKMERGFWLAKYDVENFRMLGRPVTIFNSALRNAASPEAPHIYHVGEYYYLLFAEGGTEHFHAVMAARSRELFGFYEGCPANPLMTHRHMGYTCPITNVGHADLVQTGNGDWYAVLLASRLIGGNHKNLGRETFLCPVVWEDGWPLFSPRSGRLDWEYPLPALPETPAAAPEPALDDFDAAELGLYWTVWGTPEPDVYCIGGSVASLKCVRQAPDDELRPMSMDGTRGDGRFAAFLARRQRAPETTVTAKLRFVPAGAERAGLAVVQAMNHQLHLELAEKEGGRVLRAVLVTAEFSCPPYFPGFASETRRQVLSERPWDAPEAVLQIELRGQDWTLRCGTDREHLETLCHTDGRLLNPEAVGCMCGTMLGMFATGGGTDSANRADFDWFEMT